MYLSRLRINPWSRNVRKAFANLERFHAAIEASVDDENRVLWRVDQLKGDTYLLLLSRQKPNLAFLQKQFGYPDLQGETKTYNFLLDSIKAGQTWRFKVTCNPTKSIKATDIINTNRRGKVAGIRMDEEILEWLIKQGKRNGFEVDIESVVITGKKRQKFQKGPDKFTVIFDSATIDGILTVTDPESFKRVLIEGVGREKAYGQGLLTIMR